MTVPQYFAAFAILCFMVAFAMWIAADIERLCRRQLDRGRRIGAGAVPGVQRDRRAGLTAVGADHVRSSPFDQDDAA